jgi:hypothetical protein
MNRNRSLSSVVMLAILWSGCAERPRVVRPPRDTYAPTKLTVVIEGTSETVEGAVVTRDFFSAAGVQPLLGRFLVGEEFDRGASVSVISHRYWVERFQSNPKAIGTQLNVNGRPATIVGVAPPPLETEPPTMLWIAKVS